MPVKTVLYGGYIAVACLVVIFGRLPYAWRRGMLPPMDQAHNQLVQGEDADDEKDRQGKEGPDA